MITITVTAEDIQEGEARRGEKRAAKTCPIGQAVHRVWFTPMVNQHAVFPNGHRINGLAYALMLPIEARVFIKEFDSKWHVEPFTFELEVVSP